MASTMKKMFKGRKIKYVILPDGRRLSKLMDAFTPYNIISLVGAGGKTNTMYELACELAMESKSVCISTTTRILPFEKSLPNGVNLAGEVDLYGKIRGPEDVDLLIIRYDYLLIEADGSKGLPIKAPKNHEPVISKKSEQVIAIVGLSCLGKEIRQVGHRALQLCALLDKSEHDTIREVDIAKVIMSDKGLRKNLGNRDFVVILNQADEEKDIEAGLRIARLLPSDIKCIITAYAEDD